MGRIVQLQNKKTGENEYPRTYTKAIIDDQATPLDTLMQNQNDKIAELGSKSIYKSILASDEGNKALLINSAIKELYIDKSDLSNLSNICIAGIRRNYGTNKYWSVYLYNSLTPESTNAVFGFNSVNRTASLELLKQGNSYCLIDWGELEDGKNPVSTVNPIYNINAEYVSNIENFPIIKQYRKSEQILEALEEKEAELDDLKNNVTFIENKTVVKSIFADSAKGSNIPLLDSFIKEMYIKVKSEDIDPYNIVLGVARKNYGNNKEHQLGLYIGGGSTNPILFARWNNVESYGIFTYKDSKLDLYMLADWNVLYDGENASQSTSVDYLLNYDYVGNINYSEAIARFIEDEKLHEQYVDLENKNPHSIFADTAKGDKIPYLNKAIKKLNLVLKNEEYDKNKLCFGSLRKNYGDNKIWSIAFYDDASNVNHSIYIYSKDKENKVEYIEEETDNYYFQILIDWREIEEGESLGTVSTKYLINYDYISKSDYEFFSKVEEEFEDKIVKNKNTFDVSWVDDDFVLNAVPKVVELCERVGCKCDFAVIPKYKSESDDEYPLDAVYSLTQEQLSLIKEYENKGFHIEMHPPHKGWYSFGGGGIYQGRAWVEQSMVKTIRCFNENGVLHSNCVIYPGNSSTHEDCVEMSKAWLDYGIASYGTYNNGKSTSKYSLQRLFIDFSETKTKTYYKNKIKEAYDAGAWLILGTHSNEWISDTETLDDRTKSLANLSEIIEYANSLSVIKPISQVFRKRRLMLDLD